MGVVYYVGNYDCRDYFEHHQYCKIIDAKLISKKRYGR